MQSRLRTQSIQSADGSYAQRNYAKVHKSWADIIGEQRVIGLDDHEHVGEIIVSMLEMASGKSLEEVISTWNGSTAVLVGDSLKDIDAGTAVAKGIDSYL